tara:strand:+ start:941 stop:1597 length:657 start_codon:yes stop_codon:yes gene_type:complete
MESWKELIDKANLRPILNSIKKKLSQININDKKIYPAKENIFRSFELTPLSDLKVVILGQDPYHGENQANGLAFSVSQGIKLPPSLINIHKELLDDIKCKKPSDGSLEPWAKEGVLLLNSILTVEENKAASHKDIGWEDFTDGIIKAINDYRNKIVFILWGSYAKSKSNFIDNSKHLIISSVHPSPLSANKGFFGSRPFSKCNEYLSKNSITEINWDL